MVNYDSAQTKDTNFCNSPLVPGQLVQFPALYRENLFTEENCSSAIWPGSTSAFPTIITKRWSPEDPSAAPKLPTSLNCLDPPPEKKLKAKIEESMTSESGEPRGSLKRENESTSPGVSGQKRKRIQVACDECRARKSRCDGIKPTCASCAFHNIPCVYEVPKPKANVTKEYLSPF